MTPTSASRAADLATREVTERLVKSSRENPADFSETDLSYLDLSGLDFKGASLTGADLYGTDFTSADLSGADLSHTRLDRSVLIHAKLAGANLEGATILRPTAFSTMMFDQSEAPDFSRARLVGVRVQARLDGARFPAADLTGANFSPFESRAGEGTITTVPRNDLTNADFTEAIMVRSDFSKAILRYTRMARADLKGAVLRGADLTGADLTGADLTGADLTGADMTRAILRGVKGLDAAVGLAATQNLDTAIR